MYHLDFNFALPGYFKCAKLLSILFQLHIQVNDPEYQSDEALFEALVSAIDTIDVTNVQQAAGQIQAILSQLPSPDDFTANVDENVDGEGDTSTLEENNEVGKCP